MPASFAILLSLAILAVFGGLLILVLRRQLAEAVIKRSVFPHQFAMQGPAATHLHPPIVSASPVKGSSSEPSLTPSTKGELILIVDDETSVRDLLCTVLLNHGYQVLSAGDGVEGIELFKIHHEEIDLVITDLHMPRSSGQTFADLVRPIRPKMPILFMSGLDSAENGDQPGPARSTDPFLLKPFKPAALLSEIHKLLHQAGQEKN